MRVHAPAPRLPQRETCKLVARLLLAALVAASAGSATIAGAQVRPDSTRRDSVKVVIPVPDAVRDSLRADSLRRAPATGARSRALPALAVDSVAAARERARKDSVSAARAGDTVKAPIAHFEAPKAYELTDRLVISREEILSSNAENLTDLLDRVPGVTTFRSGWIASVHVAAFQGDFARIRYFLDGIELDPLRAREGNILDLTDLPLWSLDGITIERGAGEVRVWMRSWSTQKTTPYTRADIFTGDLNTNGFRALLQRRYHNGMILQFGAQQGASQTGRVSQFATGSSGSTAGDGTVQTIAARIGWAKGMLSFDANANSASRDRDPLTAREGFTSLPSYKGSRREVYLRAGYGDSLHGFWSQAVVNFLRNRLEGIPDSTSPANADTVVGRTQQILAVGYRSSLWQLTALDRVRPIDGEVFHAPALRAQVGRGWANLGAFLERNAADSTQRIELMGKLNPIPWLGIVGAIAHRSPINDTLGVSGNNVRLEAGVRVRGAWIGGGIVRADSTNFASPSILGTPSVRLSAPADNGITASIRGPAYKDLRLDMSVIRWSTPQFGRPRLQSHTELALVSNWLSKFPKGEFSVDARLIHDLRGPVPFYFGVDEDEQAIIRATERTQVYTGQLQIRIQRATIFYQYRNLAGTVYEQIPGLLLPPAIQTYGVRWEFFN